MEVNLSHLLLKEAQTVPTGILLAVFGLLEILRLQAIILL